MDYANKLDELIKSTNGLISTKMVSEAGIPRIYISKFVKDNIIERKERGVYVARDYCDDEIYRQQMRHGQAVYSHETALFLHKFFSKKPKSLSMTVKTGFNTKSLRNNGVKVYSIKKDLYSLGIITIETGVGRAVNVYDIERTICDIVRSRSQIDNETLNSSLRMYIKHSRGNLSRLMSYAEMFSIKKVLKGYLDVLL
jgi:predicted transcriptional regulator of viral defense system